MKQTDAPLLVSYVKLYQDFQVIQNDWKIAPIAKRIQSDSQNLNDLNNENLRLAKNSKSMTHAVIDVVKSIITRWSLRVRISVGWKRIVAGEKICLALKRWL